MQRKIARLEETVDDWLRDYAASELGKGGDRDHDEPPPLRLNYPIDYVLHAWADYKTHGHWPRPGGFDAQDTALVEDFAMLTRHYNKWVHELADQDGGGLHDMDVDDLIVGVDRVDWTGLIGE